MWRIAGVTGAVGIEVAVAIAIGALGGQWLDRKLGTTPWLAIIGFGAGIGAAIKALMRVVRDYKRKLAKDDAPVVSPGDRDGRPSADDPDRSRVSKGGPHAL